MRILVSGMLAGDPWQGGATTAVLQYARGLERLGHEVWLVEPVDELTGERVAYFETLRLPRAALLRRGARATAGVRYDALPARFDLLLAVSGLLRDEDDLFARSPVRAYLDLDPVFVQLWAAQGIDMRLEGHTHFVTIGRTLPDDAGRDWIWTPQPVVLDDWPAAGRVERDALTSVGNWRGYGTLWHDGVRYGQRCHSARSLLDVRARVEVAYAIHPGEPDLAALRAHGWVVLDPRAVAGTPAAYRRFVAGSRAELGIAKEGYVVSHSGWFSDRSVCYLASGRPVLAQDTGFGEWLPAGAGVHAFADADALASAVERIGFDYERERRAARALAEEVFDARLVLPRLLRELGLAPPPLRPDTRAGSASTAELRERLEGVLGPVARLRRRPSVYRSSSALEELDVELPDGRRLELVLKDLDPAALTPRARAARGGDGREPPRELEVYRGLLAGRGLGTPGLHGAVLEGGRRWLLLERVRGTPLTQVGELDAWREVLRFVARLHRAFAGAPLTGLPRHDYGDVADLLDSQPRTLVHGELYAANVLVAPGRVCALDWETAAAGAGAVDVAALATGWEGPEREALLAAYEDEAGTPVDRAAVDAAALWLALRWHEATARWTPPPEHARDWLAEAAAARERLARR